MLGILAFLVVINTSFKPNSVKNTTVVKEHTIIKEVPVNKSVISISPNTIGIIFIIMFSLMLMTGFVYAFTSQVKKNKNPALKIKNLSKL